MVLAVLAACGGRTGLLVPPPPNPTSTELRAVIQCGHCGEVRGCARASIGADGRPRLQAGILFCDDRDPGCTAAACREQGNLWVDSQVGFTAPDGTPRTLYCLHPDATPFNHALGQSLVRPPMLSAASPCMMSDPMWRLWTGELTMPWERTSPPGDRLSYCGLTAADVVDGHYRCDRVTDSTWPMFTSSALAPVMCPKEALPETISLFLPPAATPEQIALGRRMIDSAAAAFSAVGSYSQPTRAYFDAMPDGRSLYYTCFPRQFTEYTERVRGPMDLTPRSNGMLPLDPGIDPFGNTYTVASGSKILVTMGTLTAFVPVVGSATVRFGSGPGGFVMTDLLLQQVGTASLGSSVTVSQGVASIDAFWTGDIAGVNATLHPTSAALTALTVLSNERYRLSLGATSAPTATRSTGRLDLHGTFADAPTGTTYVMEVGLLESQPRPQASMVSVDNLSPPCMRFADGMVGATFAATGQSSSGEGLWVAASPGGYFEAWGAGASGGPPALATTFRLPLELPYFEAARVGLTVSQPPLLDVTYLRDLRVVDRIAPTVLASLVDVPCGWEASVTTKCLGVVGQFEDNCVIPRAVLDVYRVYDTSWRLLFTGDPKCPIPPPGVPVGPGTPTLYYELAYHVVDTWANLSVSRVVFFKIGDGPPAACSPSRVPLVFYDANL